MDKEIIWRKSPNYQEGRGGRKIIAIVNHITAGLCPGCVDWMCDPAARASAHYVVTKTGLIYQLVRDEDTAWHAGVVNKPNWPLYDGTNPNKYTLGIEHEALVGEGLTEVQYQASLWLHLRLVNKWSLTPDRDHIIGHYRIDSVNRATDPGSKFPWQRLFSDLRKEESNMVPTRVIYKGKTMEGFIKEGLTYVEVRKLCEAMGKKVTWNQEKRIVEVQD